MTLALGTVQFGTAYGVAGRGHPVPEAEVRAILARAFEGGIRVLDTAPVYGDIEPRLAGLAAGLPFDVTSKVGPVDAREPGDAAVLVRESIERSLDRLAGALTTMLFHRADDLLGPHGDAAWRAAEDASRGALRLGVSCYSPETAVQVRQRYPIAVAQLPGNAFDQRLSRPGIHEALADVQIQVRSVFLQGLLLMSRSAATARVPSSALPMAAWDDWCAARRMRPVTAALAVAKTLPGSDVFVVGVDRMEHLDELLRAWDEARPCPAPALACDALDVIDPRLWSAA